MKAREDTEAVFFAFQLSMILIGSKNIRPWATQAMLVGSSGKWVGHQGRRTGAAGRRTVDVPRPRNRMD